MGMWVLCLLLVGKAEESAGLYVTISSEGCVGTMKRGDIVVASKY